MNKLEQLAGIEGYEVMDMLEEATSDSVAWGICTNEGCEFTRTVEPDCVDGICEECGTSTVSSCLVLAGIM